MDIPEIILLAVKELRSCFGVLEIEIMKNSNEIIPVGKLGVIIQLTFIKKYKIFLTYQMAEDICTYGHHIAESFIMDIVKNDLKKFERKLKLEKINDTNK